MARGDELADTALAIHGSVMNGGLIAVRDFHSEEERDRGAAAFDYLRASQAAAAIRATTAGLSDEDLEALDDAYLAEVPDDGAFQGFLDGARSRHAEDFDQVENVGASGLDEYVALIERLADLEGSTTKSNRVADAIRSSALALSAEPSGRRQLESLVHDPREGVAVWVCAAVGKWNLDLVRPRLIQIRDGGGVHSFEAKYTLRGLEED